MGASEGSSRGKGGGALASVGVAWIVVAAGEGLAAAAGSAGEAETGPVNGRG